jgi:hypothetical protein
MGERCFFAFVGCILRDNWEIINWCAAGGIDIGFSEKILIFTAQ